MAWPQIFLPFFTELLLPPSGAARYFWGRHFLRAQQCPYLLGSLVLQVSQLWRSGRDSGQTRLACALREALFLEEKWMKRWAALGGRRPGIQSFLGLIFLFCKAGGEGLLQGWASRLCLPRDLCPTAERLHFEPFYLWGVRYNSAGEKKMSSDD